MDGACGPPETHPHHSLTLARRLTGGLDSRWVSQASALGALKVLCRLALPVSCIESGSDGREGQWSAEAPAGFCSERVELVNVYAA